MSLMKFRSQKGFTLIEMMIVIAVIAILAAVLIPKSGLVQNTAKESGVEANMRVVQGLLENMMPRYKASQGATLANDLKTKINSDSVTITNPFTSGEDAGTVVDSAYAVVIGTGAAPDNDDANAGLVYVKIPANFSAAGSVTIDGYNKDGDRLTSSTITIN